jgi:1-phosphofructokinase
MPASPPAGSAPLENASIVTVTLNPAVDRLLEVDRLVPGEHVVARSLSRTAGGKGVNVSRVLAALEVASIASGFLGRRSREDFAAFLEQPLVTDAFVMLPGSTRENVTIAERDVARETHLRLPGLAVTAGALEELREKLRSLCRTDGTVIFSGSLPPGIEPGDFGSLIDLCMAAGARVAVDADGPALRAAAGRPLWLIKPNVGELEALVGRPLTTPPEQLGAARELTGRVTWVLLSRGEEGAQLVGGAGVVAARAEVPAARIRNTVGCGDALLGGFVGRLVRTADPPAALRSAVAIATASACHDRTATFEPALAGTLEARVVLG